MKYPFSSDYSINSFSSLDSRPFCESPSFFAVCRIAPKNRRNFRDLPKQKRLPLLALGWISVSLLFRWSQLDRSRVTKWIPLIPQPWSRFRLLRYPLRFFHYHRCQSVLLRTSRLQSSMPQETIRNLVRFKLVNLPFVEEIVEVEYFSILSDTYRTDQLPIFYRFLYDTSSENCSELSHCFGKYRILLYLLYSFEILLWRSFSWMLLLAKLFAWKACKLTGWLFLSVKIQFQFYRSSIAVLVLNERTGERAFSLQFLPRRCLLALRHLPLSDPCNLPLRVLRWIRQYLGLQKVLLISEILALLCNIPRFAPFVRYFLWSMCPEN